MRNIIITFLLSIFIINNIYAQTELTREKVLSMTVEQLSDLPLEELMQAVSLLGVSSVDELFSIIMNKSVSAASKKDESAFTAPLSTTNLSRAEMQTYGVTTIEEALRLIPGIIVQEKTNGNFDIHIRGLNNIPDNQMLLYTENSNTLLMIDGRICHNYAFGGIAFDMLPISFSDIDHIEVVRGATSVLYGTNAVQGVINIITKKSTDDKSFSIDVAANIGNKVSGYGSAALRKKFSDTFSAGFSVSMQNRERNTSDVYIIPNVNIFLGNNNFANGGYVSANNLEDLEYRTTSLNAITNEYIDETYSIIEPATPSKNMFSKPQKALDTKMVNGFLAFNISDDININITGGYQNSFSTCSPISDDYFSINQRTSKTAYGNIDARIKLLHINANYSQGPQNYALGVPGFKEKSQVFGGVIDYEILIDQALSIRPEVDYHYVRYEDYVENGYFDGSATITDIAPSLSLDYKLDTWRFISGFRSDKTNIPDKWNNSYQLVVSKQLNNHFLRASYARAMRSANLTNTSANYTWNRENLPLPKVINYIGNEDARIMKIDNFELGYRVRPSDALLIDLEAFYSISKDFGALQSQSSMLYLTSAQMDNFVDDLTSAWANGTVGNFISNNLGALNEKFGSKAIIQYQNLPYEIHQMGLTVTADWIISRKLIAKFNINGQYTYIDNYYKYNQAEAIASQLDQSRAKTLESLIGYNGTSIDNSSSFVNEFTNDLTSYRNAGFNYKQYAQDAIMLIEKLESMQLVDDKDAAQLYKMAYERAELEGFNILYGQPNVPKFQNESGFAWFDPSTITHNEYLAAYYAIKYDIRNDGKNYYFATQSYKQSQTENKHKHKATPSFYGSVNFIYKPINSVETSLVCNFMSEREYETMYGTQMLDARFTADLKIGYHPTNSVEIYLRGKNLFNTNKQEFVYGDKIGGSYSIGMFINL